MSEVKTPLEPHEGMHGGHDMPAMPVDGHDAHADHVMAGLPDGVFWFAVAVAVAITLWNVVRGGRFFAGGGKQPWRLELSAWPPVRRLLAARPFQTTLQIPLVLALFLIISAGLMGTQVAERNIATVLTWTLWWTLLIVDIVLLGRMWCLVCPWDALASWLRRLAFWRRRREEPLALELKWPRWLKNVYPATLLFILLTWLELGFGVTKSPRATALLGLAMILLAVIPALVFERRSFCRYGCLIGRICGLYSMLAPVEVRAVDPDVCLRCKTKDCLTGNELGYPCPTGQCLAGMSANTYCTVCTECFKSCKQDNVGLRLRPWGADLHGLGGGTTKPLRARRDEAVLALVLLSLTTFHGLTMTPAWNEALAALRGAVSVGYLTAFSVGMSLILVAPFALFAVAAAGTAHFASSSWRYTATLYAYPLIALALMYHLAHNAGHLLTEAGVLVPVLSDPYGSGQDLFGTAGLSLGALAPQHVIWAVQLTLVLLGLAWALRLCERIHRRLRKTAEGLWKLRLVAALFPLCVALVNLLLLAQPMEMRSGL